MLWLPELEPVQAAQNKTGKYVPPSLRDGASRRGESMQPNRRGERRAGAPRSRAQPPLGAWLVPFSTSCCSSPV